MKCLCIPLIHYLTSLRYESFLDLIRVILNNFGELVKSFLHFGCILNFIFELLLHHNIEFMSCLLSNFCSQLSPILCFYIVKCVSLFLNVLFVNCSSSLLNCLLICHDIRFLLFFDITQLRFSYFLIDLD